MSENIKIKHREPLFHVVKRDDMSGWKAWIIRFATIGLGMLVVGLLSGVFTGTSFADTFDLMSRTTFSLAFEGNCKMLWPFLQDVIILLALALALAPAFKMKFWNCGAEGQALMGGLASMICMIELGEKLPYPALIAVIAASSIVFGMVWAVIPALFKAFFNTNETLFTLMMNYIATQIVAYYIVIESNSNTAILPRSQYKFPALGENEYFINMVIVAVLVVLMYVYLKYSKQGYEISVVGESQNTARYIGINVKKVILRTMAISGALCGIVGMLLVVGYSASIKTDLVGGLGFTAILICWLGQFNPFIMTVMTSVVIFLKIGVGKVANSAEMDKNFADISVGIVILMLVACEFFVRYTIKFRHKKKEVKA